MTLVQDRVWRDRRPSWAAEGGATGQGAAMLRVGCVLRVADPADADAVTAVLADAYPTLLAQDYDPSVLAIGLPAMTRANPTLLASGSYYVQQLPNGLVVSCGGWTCEEPGTGRIKDGIAHVRHFGTLVGWTRKGLARGIFERCKQDALAAGVQTIMSFASLNAETFYASLGFVPIRRMDIAMGQSLSFPAVVMAWTANQA